MGTQLYQTPYTKGKLNKITDVKGIKIGHCTLNDKDIQTGVSVIIPSESNIFKEKLACASVVINGFGKTSGLVQIDELGTLESVIGLTNTLSVGTVMQSLVKYMMRDNEDIGTTTGTINVVVGECNDGHLNDIRGCHIKEQHVLSAIDSACVDFEEGAVGAGRGMSCFQMKGGIGSASRQVELDGKVYHIGSLVLTNFGLKKDFTYQKLRVEDFEEEVEKGSIMMLIATDIPMDARQLKRVCKRVPIALGRLGSYMGNGSGDIAIAFSTANKYPHYPTQDIQLVTCIHENKIDSVFRNAIDATEEAIISSLVHAVSVEGRNQNKVLSLKETLKQNPIE